MGEQSRRRKVDPRMRPKIWETDVRGQLEWDWDSIKPFSATAVGAPSSESQVRPFEAALPNRGPEPVAVVTSSSPRNNLSFVRRVIEFIDHSPSYPSSPLPEVEMQDRTCDPRPDVNEPGLRSGPHDIRVAVLIAMPSQSASRSSPQHIIPGLNPASQPSTDPPLRPSLLFESSPPDQFQPATQAGTGVLPHVEFGIAEVTVGQDQDTVGDAGGQTGAIDSGLS